MAYIKWTEKEYDTAIDAYCKMWLDQKKGKSVDVPQVVKKCVVALGNSRNYNAIRRRFSNISYVFSIHRLDYVKNVKPLENITDACAEFILNKAQKNWKEQNETSRPEGPPRGSFM